MNEQVFTPEQRIEAARKRLGDLKAVHTRWCNRDDERQSTTGDMRDVIAEMEHIAFSAGCYLDGLPGDYLRATGQEVK